MTNLKSSSFSRPQLGLFILVFGLIGYLIFRALAAPNPNLPGDLNGDNTVNIQDLSIMLSNYGTANSTADINSDGTVNVLDMSILLSHYGQSYSPASTIPASTTTHNIDGNLNESDWNVTTSVAKCVLGTCNNTASYGTVWDNTYLYVGVKVLDSSLKNDSTNCWDDDSVEVYIDPTNAGGTTYTTNDRQIVQRYNDSALCAGIGSNTGVLHAWAPITGGYSVELAIPWSNLGTTSSSGKTIGLDVGVNDDDDGTTRDSQLMWNGTAQNSTNPSGFGHLSLSGTPPAAPTASLSANPSSISSGATSTLSWNSANATSCTATWTTSHATSGSQSVSPTSTTGYSISCTGTGGTATANTTVSVSGGSTGSCSGTGNGKVGSTRGGLMGFASGYRYSQLSASDRDRYFNVIADEGVKWLRMAMENWNMTEYQDFVSHANAHGICVFGNIMANASGTHWADPTDHQAWANAAANEVSQLKGSVHVWEIWNEENTGGFWPGGNFNSYADLLHKTYLAIKGVDPNAMIMVGGPAPCGDGTQACNPINFYKTIYAWNKSQGRQGSSQLFDVAAVHPYGYPWDPLASANWGQSWNSYYQTYLLHQVMLDPNYGGPTNDGAKKIWGTEGGFPSGCPSGITNLDTCISLATAASWVQPLMDNWMNNWGSFTGPFMWYEVQDQPNLSTDREGYFGFINASWNPKQNQYNNLKAYSALP